MATLNYGQAEGLKNNLGKRVTVDLLSGKQELYIHDADMNSGGEFIYIMHKAKKPRKAYVRSADRSAEYTMHENLQNGYYLVALYRIVL